MAGGNLLPGIQESHQEVGERPTSFLRISPLVREWLEGLAAFKVVFVEIQANQKHPRRPLQVYEDHHRRRGASCIGLAVEWLRRGSGLGFLPNGDLWVLDVDLPEAVDRVLDQLAEARIMVPFLKTPSGGAHFYFRMPEGFREEGKRRGFGRMKNHLCHPLDADGFRQPMDFKLGHRTLVVAPGTLRNDILYEPQTPWMEPPVLDPRQFCPEGEFWMPNQPFLVDERPLKNRISRACAYLKRVAPVSISGRNGHKSLATVATYLVPYLQLDPHLAVYLLLHGEPSWNSRCRYPDGTPYPWNPGELMRACTDATDVIPAAGVRDYERACRKKTRNHTLSHFLRKLEAARILPPREGRISVQELREIFEAWSGETLSSKIFGDALSRDGIPTVLFTKARIKGVPGVDREHLDHLLIKTGEGPINSRSSLPSLAMHRVGMEPETSPGDQASHHSEGGSRICA